MSDHPTGDVVAVGISVSVSARAGDQVIGLLMQKAMSEAVLECNAEGISTEEKNSATIRARIEVARQLVLRIANEQPAALPALSLVMRSGGNILLAAREVDNA